MIARLLADHETLRRMAADLEEYLGEPRGVGWDDLDRRDVQRLRALQARLSRELLEHEDREKAELTAALRSGEYDAERFGREMEQAHRRLAVLIGIVNAVTAQFDGSHLHAVRASVSRLRRALEEHLDEEERTIFPLIGGADGAGA